VRWMRVVSRRRRQKAKTREEGKMSKKKEKGVEKRRERKEGVRVRVGLGVGGAIRNYCGTIDKRRLRGRTTEDSLRLSDFPSTVASLFLPPGSFGLPLLRHAVLSVLLVLCPRNLPDSSICNVQEPAHYTLVRSFYVE